VGKTSNAINADDVIWTFFSKTKLPDQSKDTGENNK
jgi:hypothetical protein